MRNGYRRMSALVRAGACVLAMLGVASPAAAQFGGLKKKLKAAAGQEAASEGAKQAGVSDAPAANAAAGNAGATGGTVVLTPEVVDQLLAGLKATKAYRDSARAGDNSFGRYNRAVEAYESAKAKCEAARSPFINRMASDEKMANQYSELMNKMSEAMGKGDRDGAMRYQEQALAMQDKSCVVKQPTQPDDYNDAAREIDTKAEQEGVKKSGLSPTEFAMARERGEGILYDQVRSDVSESEKNAVKAKSKELKPLLGIRDPEAERARKPAPAPEPAPAPAPAPQPGPGVSQGQTDMNNCMMANVHKHEKEIEALGERAKAAQEAGDMPTTLAIADTLRQLQMAGCNQGR
jgi:tetratricopeptide (TPR) repeat protein